MDVGRCEVCCVRVNRVRCTNILLSSKQNGVIWGKEINGIHSGVVLGFRVLELWLGVRVLELWLGVRVLELGLGVRVQGFGVRV